jgi:hypothetical protein
MRTLYLLAFSAMMRCVRGAPCTICRGGENITLPDKPVNVPGDFAFIDTCGTLDSLVGLVLQDADEECVFLQSVSTICGCPKPETACNLCADGALASNPTLEVPLLFDALFDGFVPTCEIVEAYLHTGANESTVTCTMSQNLMGSYCGCPGELLSNSQQARTCSMCPNGEDIAFSNNTIHIDSFPLETCSELVEASAIFLKEDSEMCILLQSLGAYCGCPQKVDDPCTLCIDDSPPLYPEKEVYFLEEAFGFRPTCALLEASVLGEEVGSDQCVFTRYISTFCGCPALENHCSFCPPGDNTTTPEKHIPQLNKFFGPASPFADGITCDALYTLQFQIDKDSLICMIGQADNWRCG